MDIENPEQFTAEELAFINEPKVYDSEGIIYVDGAGRLRDKNDPNFKLPKPKGAEEDEMRLTMFHTVNKMLQGEDQPFTKETYNQLRADGAGELEARSLLVGVWTGELLGILQHQTHSSREEMDAKLSALKLSSLRS
jgi:hypothetical protein